MSSEIVITGLQREDSGNLTETDVRIVDGVPCDGLGEPFVETDETEDLLGWPFSEARVWLYHDREILLPVDLPKADDE